MALTNSNVKSLITQIGGVDKVFALSFDNNYLSIYTPSNQFSLSDMVTIGGVDYITLKKNVLSKKTGKIDLPVTRYVPTQYLQVIFSVDDAKNLGLIDKSSYDTLF